MHIIVTGANGFIGQQLVSRILTETKSLIGDKPLSRLTLMDLSFDERIDNPCVKYIEGSFAGEGVFAGAVADLPADLVFHLASVPSGSAESNYALGVDVNINGVLNLLETLHQQGNVPRLVFASSIAVYGKPAGELVGEATLPTPNLTYGAQKVIGETLVADYARRGWITACSLRLPGIVVRPPEPNGAVSIFFSDLIRSLSSGEPYTCPVSEKAKSWLMSVECCVDNIVNGVHVKSAPPYTWTLPALHLSIGELVGAIDDLYPEHKVQTLITYKPDPWVEENFGSYPPLFCKNAELSGFKNDHSLNKLIKRSLSLY